MTRKPVSVFWFIFLFCFCLSQALPTLEKDSFLLTTSLIFFLREELVRLLSYNSSGSLIMELCSNDLEGSLFVYLTGNCS